MSKKLIMVICAAVMAFALTACASGGASSSSASSASGSAASSASASSASADLGDTLVVYSTHPEDLLEAISAEFTAETGVKVEFINLKGELADRVRSEKNNPQADIMFGGDEATYMALQQDGCYEPTKPSWAADVSAEYKDAEGNWYGTYRTPMVLFYNKDSLSQDKAPTDWADLAKPEFKDQIVTRDSLSSSMRSTIVSLVQYNMAKNGETAAWDYISALNSNIKNYYNSGSLMFQAVGKGEATVSMAVINDVFKNRDKNEMPLEMVIPSSGAIVITDCIAKTKNAPHSAAADAFIEFIGSKKCQVMNAKDFNRMPITDQYLSECPEWMSTKFSAMEVDWSDISKNQAAWLEKWETDYLDAAKVNSDK